MKYFIYMIRKKSLFNLILLKLFRIKYKYEFLYSDGIYNLKYPEKYLPHGFDKIKLIADIKTDYKNMKAYDKQIEVKSQ